jgi:CRP-like cAMP-binding protein
MSLLTGEPRAATVVAQTRVEVLVLDKESMSRLLKNNPLLVEQISRVLVARKSDLVAHQERAAQQGGQEKGDPVRTLGDRIRKFFGLA